MPAPRNVPVSLLACAALAACGGDGERAASRAAVERVFLISCDTLRADRLGHYGYQRGTSPRLDELARECTVFEEAYSTSPMTQPSLASLFTGRLPEEVGAVPGNMRILHESIETLPERLSAAGVTTAAVVSNWILRRQPAPLDGAGLVQGFDHFDDEMTTPEPNRPNYYERLADDTTDAAIRWLEGADLDEPLFLWVHYMDPHGPYTPPSDVLARFETPPSADEELVRLGRNMLGRGQIPRYQRIGDERRPSFYRDRYDAEISFFDGELGRLLDWLRERDLLAGSLLIFTSDHGESLGEHDYWFSHGEHVYRDLVRVPFLVRYPEGLAGPGDDDGAGYRRCERVVGHVDVWPTVSEALGVDPGPSRGVSLLHSEPPAGRLLGQSLVPGENRPPWSAVTDGRWRVVWNAAENQHRLFDLRSDPGELNDLAATNQERVTRMMSTFMADLQAGPRAPAASGHDMRLDDEAMKALEQLGYTGD